MAFVADKVTAAMSVGPVVLLGDFNIEPHESPLDIIFALGLRHAAMDFLHLRRNDSLAGLKKFPRTEAVSQTHIDHVFYTGASLDLLDWHVNDDGGKISDHLAVSVDFRFK